MSSNRRVWLLAFTCVLLLATALRLRGLRRWSFNNDEVCEASWSSLPFAGMMSEVRRDAVHPPLDYLVQFAVGRLHGPEWTRRLPQVAAGVITIALVMLLGRIWLGYTAGVMAGLLMALSPIHIRYSQELRPYSLALLFVTASLVALEMYARSERRRWAVAWAALVFMSGATLYFAGLVAGVTGVFRIFMERRRQLRLLWKWLPAVIVVWTVLYSPWFPVISHVAHSPAPAHPEALDSSWWSTRLEAYAAGPRGDASALGSGVFWIFVALGVAASAWRTPLRTAVVWLLGCGALQILVLQIRPHFYPDPRNLLASIPAAYVLAGAGTAVLARRRTIAVIAAAGALVFAAYCALYLHAYYSGERSDWQDVTAYVRDRARPGETIVLTNDWVVRNFGYYWATTDRPPGVVITAFEVSPLDLEGPTWFVSAQCAAHEPLSRVGLMHRWPVTEEAEVRYLKRGERISLREPLCPE